MTDAQFEEIPIICNKAQLCLASGLSRNAIDKLIDAGRIPVLSVRAGQKTTFDLREVFGALVKGVHADPLSEAALRKAEAAAVKLEIANKKESGKLWDADETRQAIVENVATFRAGILDLSDRLPATCPDDIRTWVRDEAVSLIERLNAGLSNVGA